MFAEQRRGNPTVWRLKNPVGGSHYQQKPWWNSSIFHIYLNKSHLSGWSTCYAEITALYCWASFPKFWCSSSWQLRKGKVFESQHPGFPIGHHLASTSIKHSNIMEHLLYIIELKVCQITYPELRFQVATINLFERKVCIPGFGRDSHETNNLESQVSGCLWSKICKTLEKGPLKKNSTRLYRCVHMYTCILFCIVFVDAFFAYFIHACMYCNYEPSNILCLCLWFWCGTRSVQASWALSGMPHTCNQQMIPNTHREATV